MKPSIQTRTSRSILTKASGFLHGYSHTLNPYAGCAFGCSYCYVRRMPIALFREEDWGEWVDIKENAVNLVKKEIPKARKKGKVSIFMSSSTDPYQPVENKTGLTRGLLEAMAEEPPDFLFLQTRSPLVSRDINLLKKLGSRIMVSMTVETDLDSVRKIFAPSAPPIAARLKALKELSMEGIPVQAAIAPLLPCSDEFPNKLSEVTNRITLDDFFMGDGSGGKRTEQLGIRKLFEENGLSDWYDRKAYLKIKKRLEKTFNDDAIYISQEGFFPPE
ncbi:SPL family radical SAM protein [Pseudalkalibacillus hwajinpoensis]|uniref:Radical SAM protein n=1 Tax=Guptibacillus hwajinpoensis TaxID=208199 RepID=A0A4U1MM17_9BACL|nr:radical SAM protein [Pseudalkalibacillus hwajinpoensis]TKD72569.1 radical SAM protein [Pseudalkalibacillus hwajinpoensis]